MKSISSLSQTERATGFGFLAIMMWSFSSLMVNYLVSVPPLQLVTMVFTLTFLLTATRVTHKKRWGHMRQPYLLWVVGILGIAGNDITFFAAFHYAPAQHVELINYFWPILVLVFVSIFTRTTLSVWHLSACALGFIGVSLVLLDATHMSGSQYPKLWLGYGLAFADALIWATYTVLSNRYKSRPVEMIGLYCGVGALFTGGLHFIFEPTVIPHLSQWAVIVVMAASAHGLAYFFWDYGVKRGDYKILSIVAYAGPVLSYLWLVLAGVAPYCPTLFFSAGLIAFAGLLGTQNEPPTFWLRIRDWMAVDG